MLRRLCFRMRRVLGPKAMCSVVYGCILAVTVYVHWYKTNNGTEDIGTLNFPPKKYVKPYHRHDFFKDKPFHFDERFKNPCWYEGSKLRCLPYCLIYGIRKSATTSLFARLLNHPEVYDWGEKEAQFFGYGQMYKQKIKADQISAYVDMFDKGARKIDRISKKKGNNSAQIKHILVDGSTDSMYINYDWNQYPGNENLREPKILASHYVHHFMPNAKIIVVIRDPIERLYSEYYFIHGLLFKQNNTNQYSFHKCVEYLVGLYKECFRKDTVRACVYNSTLMRSIEPSMLLNLGIYYVYMEDIFRIFGRDQVLVLHVEDVDDISHLKHVFRFLELGSLPDKKIANITRKTKLNTRRGDFKSTGSMLAATRRLLTDFYKPFNERMASLMNDKYYLFQPS